MGCTGRSIWAVMGFVGGKVEKSGKKGLCRSVSRSMETVLSDKVGESLLGTERPGKKD